MKRATCRLRGPGVETVKTGSEMQMARKYFGRLIPGNRLRLDLAAHDIIAALRMRRLYIDLEY